MAQFGIHALIGLWICWSLPLFSPYLLRLSFGVGIFIGNILPDIDLYAYVIAYFVKGADPADYTRNATHSVVTATCLLVVCVFIEYLSSRNYKLKKVNLLYDVESSIIDDDDEDEDSLLALTGALSTRERSLGINFRAFGFGLYAGMMMHIFLDIIFWFKPINLLYPLPLFGIGQIIDAWKMKEIPYIAEVILSLSELLLMALYFTVLRVSVLRRLGKWANMPDDYVKKIRTFTDNDIEHASMDFSLQADSDICPIDQKTLSLAKPTLSFLKILIIFQFLYFILSCALPFISFCKLEYLQIMVFVEIVIVAIPACCYVSWRVRDVIMRKSI